MAGSLFRSAVTTDDCVFTSQEFYKVCILAQDGKQQLLEQFVKQVLISRRCRIGPKTFCPNEKSSSAFVLAAQNGRLDVLKYILRLAPTIDLNHLAKAYFYRGGQTHICTALYAACRQGNLKVVQELLAAGSSIDLQCNCCNETPLRVAAFFGFFDVVALLLAEGADTTATDTPKNWTPLMAATFRGHTGVVSLLLQNGADPHQQNPLGYTAVHTAAVFGCNSVIEAFVSQVVFHTADHPPALFVAAAIGHRDVVASILTHPDIPPKMRVDAIKILGPPWLEPLFPVKPGSKDDHHTTATAGDVDSDSHTNDATDLRVDLDLCSVKSSIIDVYCQTNALQELVGRCTEKELTETLFERGKVLFESTYYAEAETLWIRLMKLMATVLGPQGGLIQYICPAIEQMVTNRYEPCFSSYLMFILDILKRTDIPDDEKGHHLNSALNLMSTWLHYDYNYRPRQSTSDYDVHVGSDECEAQGCLLVQQNLYPFAFPRNSLLITILGNLDSTVITPPFIHALLRWGADSVVNSATIEGERPLHYVARRNPSLIPVLLAHGAHLDAVNSLGCTPYAIAITQAAKSALSTGSPPPLVCLACRAIVSHGIHYYADQHTLPQNLLTFIKLHDGRFCY